MKKYSLLLFAISLYGLSNGQQVSIALDKMNILYVGVDNPITIAVENTSNKSIIVKTTNGEITSENGRYNFRGTKPGRSDISIYKKVNKKLVKIGSSAFRVKSLPLPVFKIGSGIDRQSKAELVNQQFVRAEMENSDFDMTFKIDSFTVCIVPGGTCKYIAIKNLGNEINSEIREEFTQLKENDVVIFKRIFARIADGSSVELQPVMVSIYK